MHLSSAVIKHTRTPFLMLLFERVGIFIARLAVKFIKTKRVFWEMRAHPIQYDAYLIFVTFIDKIFKVVGSAVSRSGRKHTAHLISPTALVRIFAYRQYFNMGVSHLFDVCDKLVRQVSVIQNVAVCVSAPTAHVQFVYVYRRMECVEFFSLRYPILVRPLKSRSIEFGRVGRRSLAVSCVRIGFEPEFALFGLNAEFIYVKNFKPCDKAFPYPVADFAHRMYVSVPIVEISNYAYRLCVRRPHPEHPAFLAVPRALMRRHKLVCLIICSLVKEVNRYLFIQLSLSFFILIQIIP